MLARFLLYGCAGWVLEVVFTGVSSALFQRDRHGTAKTYLWMHPIYGATALGLEYLQDRLKHRPRAVRALAYTAVIFGAEFATGWALRRVLGRCPWDYTARGWNVQGLIRLDYAPAWYATALLFEPVRTALTQVTEKTTHALQEVGQAVEHVVEQAAERVLQPETPEAAPPLGRGYPMGPEESATLH